MGLAKTLGRLENKPPAQIKNFEDFAMYEFLSIHDGPVVDGMEDEEVVFAKNQPPYLPLRTLVSDRGQKAISRWSLTPAQRKLVSEGADIFLELLTFGQPLQPIRIALSDGKLDNDWVRVCLLSGCAKNTEVK